MARLPLKVLYGLADIIYVILYYIVRYRRHTVADNLRKCFPDSQDKQLHHIEKQFYHNFADNAVETLKLLHISDEEMHERMQFRGVEQVEELLQQGKSVIGYFSHCFNWEWAPSFTRWCHPFPADSYKKVDYCQIYRPLRNRWFDRLMLEIRSRFQSVSIPKKTTLRTLLTYRREGVLTMTGFMSDQKPSHGDPTYVTRLLGRPTAMITGTETLGRRLGMAAVYWDMQKTSRGHYLITVQLITPDIASTPEMSVTEQYTRHLEATIRRDPSLWLWTHKRWKIPVKIENPQP